MRRVPVENEFPAPNSLDDDPEFMTNRKTLDDSKWLGPDWSQAPEHTVAWSMASESSANWFTIYLRDTHWVSTYQVARTFGYIGDWRKSLRVKPHD